jgi:TatA/E family protein of Tat protein translocase
MLLGAFRIGSPADWAMIAVIALLVFGPKRLPKLGRQLEEAVREFEELRERLRVGIRLTPGGIALLLVAFTLSLWLGLMLVLPR